MKVTIITINLNNAQGLEKTILSVIGQTYRNFEYLIIDGKSEDSSCAIIDKYKNHINYSISEKDSGIYNAMNKAINKSKGDYLLFLNSGDVFYSEFTLEDTFKNSTNCDFIFGGISISNNKREFIIKLPKILTFGYLVRFGINHQSTFIKRSLFDIYGLYDESLKIASDWKFLIIALCKYNSTFQIVNTIISIYDPYGISSNNKNTIQLEKRLVLETMFPMFVDDYDRYFKLNRFTLSGIINIANQIIRNLTFKKVQKIE